VVLSPLASLCVPVAVAVAMLRYRLWDLDRLVSRTVTYTVVTALLALPSLLILPAVTRLAGDAGSLAVAGATLAAAAAFAPLRRRVQDLVDRRFNRARYDAARTVAGFAIRLRDQVDLETLPGRAAYRGRRDRAADPGVAVAALIGDPAAAAVAQRPTGQAMLALPDTLSGPEAKPGHRPPPIASHHRDQRCSDCRRQRCLRCIGASSVWFVVDLEVLGDR
jgi:hypothetical protein